MIVKENSVQSIIKSTIARAARLSFADQINSRFNKQESHFVSLSERVDALIKTSPGDPIALQKARKTNSAGLTSAFEEFENNYPKFAWSGVRLVKARACKLSDIVIDDTMNRPLVWRHVLKIIKKFKQTKVMAINVYEDPELPGKYIAWDGQHTAVVLYLLAVRYCGLDPADIEVPIAIYDATTKAEIRENFIVLNSDEGKESLSALALFSNKVFGVRIDHSNNPEWVIANRKQLALSEVGLFLTEDASVSDYEGAITLVKEIDKASLSLVKNFCTYWKHRQIQPDNDRANYVEAKELMLMLQLLKLCEDEKCITKDNVDEYLESMVDIFYRTFGCNFSSQKNANPLFKQIDRAYKNWYDRENRDLLNGVAYTNYTKEERDSIGLPERLVMTKASGTKKQDPYVRTFLIAQLKKAGFQHKLPKPEVSFKIDATDFFKLKK